MLGEGSSHGVSPMEQRVNDGLQVLQRVFLEKTKYLNLASVLRVIDDK